jgi:hypothetical protein
MVPEERVVAAGQLELPYGNCTGYLTRIDGEFGSWHAQVKFIA